MSPRGKKGTGTRWDAKGKDIPEGRVSRSLVKGLTHLPEKESQLVVKKRYSAMELLRRHARAAEPNDRDALWALVPRIGESGYPDWDEVVAARHPADFIALAYRGRVHAETGARSEREAAHAETRTCRHSVAAYAEFREEEEFSPQSDPTVMSTLRRFLTMQDEDGVPYADRLVATLTEGDVDHILRRFRHSPRLSKRGQKPRSATRDKYQRHFVAWLAWEIENERLRAMRQRRAPLYVTNVFGEETNRFSRPVRGRHLTVDEKEATRRFLPDEVTRIIAECDQQCSCAGIVTHRLGLRISELTHLRWLIDVIPLEGGHGYDVRIQGGRMQDTRCTCASCWDEKGWAPKNGPRRYVLDRRVDEIDWVTAACDALDRWVALLKPEHGDFMFPSYSNRRRAWTTQDLGRRFRNAAAAAGVAYGQNEAGGRTFHSFRHACASEMVERGVPHPLAAEWIGDTLKEFQRTYGRPDPRVMAAATLAGSGRSNGAK